MNQSIEYEGQKVKLGQTPYGEWLRGELDNRRGVVDGKWGIMNMNGEALDGLTMFHLS
ncbi:MAG: hypothetical protein HWD62_10515 [Cyclobacteriaceae bacterium]|nr:MAG: hypothetical protein HWD62_10515 [Cyclobacteriaceae bacterium]